MWYITAVICAIVLAWGIAYCGKNIGIGLIEIAKSISKVKK